MMTPLWNQYSNISINGPLNDIRYVQVPFGHPDAPEEHSQNSVAGLNCSILMMSLRRDNDKFAPYGIAGRPEFFFIILGVRC
jgi:hypothetical protein